MQGFAFAVLLAGCGEAREVVPPPPIEAPVHDVDDPFAARLSDVRRAATDHGALAAERAGTAEGVAAGRRAAELARILSLRDPEAEWTGRARAWLDEASRRADVAGACEAAGERIDLEARDTADLSSAYRLAYRTTLRFEGDSECVAHARQVLETLAPWAPEPSALEAIEAEFHGETAEEANETAGVAAWAAEHAGDAAAHLEGLTVYSHGGEGESSSASARVVLRFDHIVGFEHGESDGDAQTPRRTWLELAGVAPTEDVAVDTQVAEAGLRRIVLEQHGPNTRAIFELDLEARFRVFALPDPFRIVFDVEPGGPTARGPVRRVMLDPGHGGDDFGARAFGMRESDLTLEIARRARVMLARRLPDVQVLLTREDDTLVSLEQRVAMANAVDADLFVSVHLNAADEEVDRGGVTTFVLDTSNDRQALRLAARENGTTVAQVDSLSHLLASLHREEQVRESRGLAEQIHRSTLTAGRVVLPTLHDRGVKSAMFYVLVGARMPAVLLEASFLSREEEAMALRTARYRQTLAEGVADGIARYAGR